VARDGTNNSGKATAMKKKAITREQFLDADDLTEEWVDLPASYGKDAGVYVRHMTGEERSLLEDKYAGDDKTPVREFRVAVLLATVVDDDDNALFNNDDDVALMGKNAGVLERCFDKSCKINGLTKKDVEVLEKNSGSDQST
jgi:hypothetical protein